MTYNERSQEFFSLASKKAVLETNNNDAEEYEHLVERMQELRGELDATLDELCPTAILRDVETYDG